VAGLVLTVLVGLLATALQLHSNTKFVMTLQSLPFATRLLIVITAGSTPCRCSYCRIMTDTVS
jgi:hypothetical protein